MMAGKITKIRAVAMTSPAVKSSLLALSFAAMVGGWAMLANQDAKTAEPPSPTLSPTLQPTPLPTLALDLPPIPTVVPAVVVDLSAFAKTSSGDLAAIPEVAVPSAPPPVAVVVSSQPQPQRQHNGGNGGGAQAQPAPAQPQPKPVPTTRPSH